MTTNENEVIAQETDTETTENEMDIEVELEEGGEDVEALKKQITTLQAQKEHWRNKATKAKEAKVETKSDATNSPALSIKDQMALLKADIDADDVEQVLEFSKFKNVPLSEALKSPTLKGILAERKEQRESERVAVSGNKRQTTTKVTDEGLLNNAKKGNLPESPEEMERLFNARMGIKG